MDTVNIKIPTPDFTFSDVIKSQANDFCNNYLTFLEIISDGIKGTIEDIYKCIRRGVNNYSNQSHKIIFIGELILFLNEQKKRNGAGDIDNYLEMINYLQFELYNLASNNGYNFDINVFTDNEVSDLNSKIDSILSKLNEVQLGQEILFDEIGELKADFESLKSDYVLGKKRWYQRAAGIVVNYGATVTADETIKPLIIDLLKRGTHQVVDGVIKLLS